MRYVRTFESFIASKNLDQVNEELLGNLINFFKNLWSKATEELKKMGKNPNIEQIDTWFESKIFNTSDSNYIFKSITDEFKKKTEANSEDCLSLVDSILDPLTGALGTQGLQPLYDDLKSEFKENLAPIETIRFYLESIRNRAIKDFKYMGGPDLKIGQDPKIDPKNRKIDLTDTTHLPDVKKLLQSTGDDNKKKKDVIINWVEKTLIPKLISYLKEIKPEQVSTYLSTKGIKPLGDIGELKKGDTVVYKRDKFSDVEWGKATDDDKRKTDQGIMKDLQDKEMIGIKRIKEITGDDISFEGADFKKKRSDILMKVEVSQSDEAKKAAESLGKIKTDPDKMKTVADLANMLQDDTKKTQVDQIKNILGGDQ